MPFGFFALTAVVVARPALHSLMPLYSTSARRERRVAPALKGQINAKFKGTLS